MRLFDTHAHYDSGAFNADRMEVLSSMPDRGVELILNPGCELESSQTAVELAERFPFVYAAVGVHPSDCGDWEDGWLDELRSLAARPKVKAIGEIGLDYYWKENPPREHQQQVFHKQLELAEELLSNQGRLEAMSEAMKSLALPDATDRICGIILDMVK